MPLWQLWRSLGRGRNGPRHDRRATRKARRLATRDAFAGVRFEKGYIENTLLEAGSVDVLISNGVINLCADKASVFLEIARVLKPGVGWRSPTSSPRSR
jgi:ubiquinone/menaquinone biosynthesis C-methylase UbiE